MTRRQWNGPWCAECDTGVDPAGYGHMLTCSKRKHNVDARSVTITEMQRTALQQVREILRKGDWKYYGEVIDELLDGADQVPTIFLEATHFKCKHCDKEVVAGGTIECDRGPCPMEPINKPSETPIATRLAGAAGLLAGAGHRDSAAAVLEARGILAREAAIPGPLTVWSGSMPESNGKSNFTAILHRGDLSKGHTIDRSEYPDRVRYEADRVRWLIGETDKEPWILDYDADKRSDYVAPATPAKVEAWMHRRSGALLHEESKDMCDNRRNCGIWMPLGEIQR